MKKTMTVILSVVLFVVLAGGVMIGVGALSGHFGGTNETQASVKNADPGAEEKAPEVQEAEPETVPEQASEAEPVPEGEAGDNGSSSESAAKKPIVRGETVYGGVTAIDVSGVVEACMPEVVAITNTTVIKQQGYNSFYDYFYGRGSEQEYTTTASGSGVIVHETEDELLIVTNKHVVEGASELEITFIDGKTAKADLKGNGGNVDIAVIAIPLSSIDADTRKAIKIAKLHEEEDLKPGQGVIAIGNAMGYGQSVTVGVISALGRELEADRSEVYTNLIQTDAAINPGNSGGALLNNEGELIGINVAKLANTEIEGVGFAIPIYNVKDIIYDLYNTKTKVKLEAEDQGRLGVYMNTIGASESTALNMPEGVIVLGFSDEVIEGYEDQGLQYSPAREAGIQKNDIITKFDGQAVTDAQSLSDLVKYYEAGAEVEIVVQRIDSGEYKEKTFTVKLGSKNDEKIGQSGELPENTEEASEETQAPAQEQETPAGGDGNNGFGYNDLYDFFRQYIDQYQR